MIRGIIFDCFGVLVHDNLARDEQMVALVRSLHSEYQTALLSNIGRGRIESLFAPGELDELFDTVLLSSEVGFTKPHADIYELTAQRLGLLPEECIMIDDLEMNVTGAIVAGMHGLLYVTREQCQADLQRIVEDTHARTT